VTEVEIIAELSEAIRDAPVNEIRDAIQAAILSDNWDLAIKLFDAHDFDLCLVCFSTPTERIIEGKYLFCASCKEAHQEHPPYEDRNGLRGQRWMTGCPHCQRAHPLR
jgi:hypothetical protein